MFKPIQAGTPTPSRGTRDSAARPKLIFFGDPHGDFSSVIRVVLDRRPEAIILLGDMEACHPLQIELAPILDVTDIWFIPGNHDTDDECFHDHLWGSALADHNLHGRVCMVAGYKVAGLSGVFRESIWNPAGDMHVAKFTSAADLRRHMRPHEHWRGGISLRHRSSIFPDDYTRLSKQRADILVTHEGPGGTPHGQPLLSALADAMGVRLLVHGHLHRHIDYQAEGRIAEDSRFLAYGIDQGSHLCWPNDERATGEQP